MLTIEDLHPSLVADLLAKGVDLPRTLAVLESLNRETTVSQPAENSKAKASDLSISLPSPDDPRIKPRLSKEVFQFEKTQLESRLKEFDLPSAEQLGAETQADSYQFGETALYGIGVRLYPQLAYGVLNGGSATSYFDPGKNADLDSSAFMTLEPLFQRAADAYRLAPKGLAPAFLLSENQVGPSFLMLKMRGLLLRALEYQRLTGEKRPGLLPFFQMTSTATDKALTEAYRDYRNHQLLAPLIEATESDPCTALSAVQPLLAALSPATAGQPRTIFSQAGGQDHCGLALPGGHGENYRVLADIYRSLAVRGIRWAYLGNVDNIGYTIDPVALALTALSGAQAAFEFSRRTAVDVKGGVLAVDNQRPDRFIVAEIGQSITSQRLAAEERSGKTSLFNCATGLFDLDYLVPRLDEITKKLPIRVSEQEKQLGRYAQAEQNTWEILGLLDKALVLSVAKTQRFIAAKTFMETLLASPVSLALEGSGRVPAKLAGDASVLRTALTKIIKQEYGLDQFANPLPAD